MQRQQLLALGAETSVGAVLQKLALFQHQDLVISFQQLLIRAMRDGNQG